uniref:Uncharacterized protein n=1 Tax=Anguilla anguilla TaxID=7936 RepID=A0A0E9W8S1_ANGAN
MHFLIAHHGDSVSVHFMIPGCGPVHDHKNYITHKHTVKAQLIRCFFTATVRAG